MQLGLASYRPEVCITYSACNAAVIGVEAFFLAPALDELSRTKAFFKQTKPEIR